MWVGFILGYFIGGVITLCFTYNAFKKEDK